MDKNFLFKEVLSILNNLLGKNTNVSLHEPSFTKLDKEYLINCI